MNITHYVMVNGKFQIFNSARTPNGGKQFCELMDGRGRDMGTDYLISALKVMSSELVHRWVLQILNWYHYNTHIFSCPYKGSISIRNATIIQRLIHVNTKPIGEYYLSLDFFTKNLISMFKVDFFYNMILK